MRWWRGSAWLALGLMGCGAPERHFDAEAAFAHLVAQVEFGSRAIGQPTRDAAAQYLEDHLRSCADMVTVHTFDVVCAVDSTAAGPGRNLIAVFRPAATRRYLFGAHWDTRPVADSESDPALAAQPVPGANDGASGVAVLLEVASALKRVPPEVGVDLVLFDAEDCGIDGDAETWALGSAKFVADHPEYRPAFVLIADMVARRGVRIPKEGASLNAAPQLTESVWRIAAEIGATTFVDSVGQTVFDDHIPFLRAGIPAVNLIDMDDPHWHTTRDLPEFCSPEPLEDTGRLILELIRRGEEAARR